MLTLLKSCMKGPDWPELTVPEWYPPRAEAIIAHLGEDNPESKAFKRILTAGRIEEEAIEDLDRIAGKSNNVPTIMLAMDIAQHAFATIRIMTTIPLRA